VVAWLLGEVGWRDVMDGEEIEMYLLLMMVI
jgi:hypothetical protein